jgi:hypothetical protein
MTWRSAFIVSFAVNMILVVVALAMSPREVAIHFGVGGKPDGWAPAYVHALVMSGIHILIFASFFFVPNLLRTTPDRWISLPNREHWLKDENRGRMESILTVQLYQFGTSTLVFMFVVGLLVLHANLSNPVRLREDLFWWAVGFYLAYTAYWTLKTMLAFRKPNG